MNEHDAAREVGRPPCDRCGSRRVSRVTRRVSDGLSVAVLSCLACKRVREQPTSQLRERVLRRLAQSRTPEESSRLLRRLREVEREL